jgi:hypothetical protein
MADPDVDIDALLVSLDQHYETLSRELSEIEDDERRGEISATLSTIETQKQHLLEQREERRSRGQSA